MNLDAPEAYATLDPGGMIARIAALPAQCRKAWQEAEAFPLPKSWRGLQSAAVFGMGGSAIGADFVAGLNTLEGAPPLRVVRDYTAPADLGARTLAIASSYSGNTEETLASFKQALGQGAHGLAITTGGRLATLCRERAMPCFPIPYSGPPRSALGYSVFPLLSLLHRLSLSPDRSSQAQDAIAAMERAATSLTSDVRFHANPAKQLVRRIGDSTVVIYGAQHLTAVARRWKTQIAENAKSWAFFEAMPELHHNSIEGMAYPTNAKGHLFAIVLHSARYSTAIARRSQLTCQVLDRGGIAYQVVDAQGETPLAQSMTAALFGDFFSAYLAIQRGVDPSPNPTLDWFKQQIASN